MGCIGGNKEVTDPVTPDPVDPNGVEEPTSTDEYYHARFNSTQGMRMDNLDLFGCGAYGLSCVEGSGDLIISNSYIRDCSYTPFEIYDCIGDFQFVKCNITGSDGGGYFERNEDTNLFFFGCSFGQEESNLWYFRDDVTKEDCEFMEPTIYPDYSEGE